MKHWLLAACLFFSALAHGETWSFALIGDVPYSNRERRELPRMLDAIADSNVAFVAHVGDIKHGQERCDDALFEERQRLFDASRVPFIFVPGDNEWTDCIRVSNGGYDPLERLAALRTLFWQRPDSLGRKTSHLNASLVITRNTRTSASGQSSSSPSTCRGRTTILAGAIRQAPSFWHAIPLFYGGSKRISRSPGRNDWPASYCSSRPTPASRNFRKVWRTADSANFLTPCAAKRWTLAAKSSRSMVIPISAGSIIRCATATENRSPT